MGFEKRSFKRFPVELNGILYLCRGVNGDKISQPVSCRVYDLSRSGTGLFTSRVLVGNHHLFFAALESDEIILHLEISLVQDNGTEKLSLPMRPVWFDRVLDKEHKPFKIRAVFYQKIPTDLLTLLKNQPS